VRILVTGSTGVVGIRLIPLLLRAGHRVSAVARSAGSRDALQRQGAVALDLNLFDRDAVCRAVEGHDTIVNLATHMPSSTTKMFFRRSWRENDRLRREASATLVEAARAGGTTRFIQESFAPVYPDRAAQWIDEATPIAPVAYNRTIADAEAHASAFSGDGRAGIVLRFGAFYGADAAQVAELIGWLKRGWAPIPGPAGAYLSSCSHDDAASAVAEAVALPAGTYNVADDEPVTHEEYVASLARALKVPVPRLPPSWLTALSGSLGELLARSVRVSNRKLRSMSRWEPKYPSVREGWPALIAQMTVTGTM
jgi:nucleoside-diphosphate-sugar epimerase